MTPEEFFAVLHDVPEVKPQQHRLYHDPAGRPLFYTMEDLPGSWVEVSAGEYAVASHDVLVKNGKLVPVVRTQRVDKLRPSADGVACHPQDICLIVETDRPHQKWRLPTHE